MNTCAYHTSISKSAPAASQNCTCHRSKNSEEVSCEHLRLPHVHFKECTGCFSNTAPATGPKTLQGFLVNTCAYHASISKSAPAASQNCTCHRSKNSAGVSCEHLRLPHVHFKRVHGLLLKTAPATAPKTVQRFLVNTCAYHTSISKSARVAFQHCACHRSKNSEEVSCEHLRIPHVHFKECTGCFSKLCLPQVQKQCRGFL